MSSVLGAAPGVGPGTASLDVGYRVRFDEAGPDGRVHPSVLLAWAQDAAWVHSTALGFGREWYAERGLTWLVRAAELTLVDPPAYGDDVVVATEVVGFRRVLARRETTIRATDGRTLAVATTDWALLDAAGRPTRIPDEFGRLAPVGPFAPLDVPGPPAGAAPGDPAVVPIAVRARDVDPMGHANNAAYVGYVEEALTRSGHATLAAALPRTYRLAYLRPALPGVPVSAQVHAGARDGRVVLTSPDGTLLRAEVSAVPVRAGSGRKG